MPYCAACGVEQTSAARFCHACGAAQTSTEQATTSQDSDSAGANELLAALESALTQYSGILSEVQTGQITPDEGQRRAFRAGLVIHDDEAWMLDPLRGSWSRYNGLRLETVPATEAS